MRNTHRLDVYMMQLCLQRRKGRGGLLNQRGALSYHNMTAAVIVPVMLAVLCWAAMLIGGGMVLAALPLQTLQGVLTVLVGAVLLVPVWRLVRHVRAAGTVVDPVVAWVGAARRELVLAWVLTAAAFVAVAAGISNIVIAVLTLPFHAVSPFLFQMELFYRPVLGPSLAGVLYEAGMVYIHALWLYLLSGIVVDGIDKVAATRG